MSQEEFDRDERELRALFERTAVQPSEERARAMARRAAEVPAVRVRRTRFALIAGALSVAAGLAVAVLVSRVPRARGLSPAAAIDSAAAQDGSGADDADAAADSADDDDSAPSLDDLATDDPRPEQAIALQEMLDER